jgi:hypothetical protein
LPSIIIMSRDAQAKDAAMEHAAAPARSIQE